MDTLTRLFFIINKLLEKSYTINKLQNMLVDAFQLEELPSRHVITDDIKRIEKAGFIVNKGKVSRANSYKIIKTPFKYELDKENTELIKNIFATYSNNTLIINNFFENISTLLQFEIKDIIPEQDVSKYKNKDIYFQIKNVLQKAINDSHQSHRKVRFDYLSSENEKLGNPPITHDTFPYKMLIDDKKMERVRVYNPQPKTPKLFNLNRIVSIPELLDENISKEELLINYETARFKLYPPASRNYNLCDWLGETKEVEDHEKEIVIIKTPYYTAFDLFQKIMKYGECAEVIYPPDAVKEIKTRIEKMHQLYS